MTGIEIVLVGAALWLLGKARGGSSNGGDGDSSGGNGDGDSSNGSNNGLNIKAKKVPSGNPYHWPDPTFNHTDWPSVRLQYNLLGYANQGSKMPEAGTKPEGGFVRNFQRDYNSVSAACLNGLISCGGFQLGKLDVDGKTGAHTTDALENAKQVQALALGRTPAKTWQKLVTQAREAGY